MVYAGVDVLCPARDRVGESPLWSAAEQALYWVDIEGRHVRRLDWATQALETWDVPERIGCIALAGAGSPRRLVGALEGGIHLLTLDEPPALRTAPLATVRHAAPAMRFNDGRCDRQGRFLAGTMCMDMALASAHGALYRLDARGLSAPLVDGLIVPNGLAFSPDGRTMYLSDSHPSVRAVWRFDYDLETGTPGGRHLFVDMKRFPGRPDGAAVDVDGGYWSCANDAGLVHRFTPDGRLDRSLAVPVAKPAMCAFGGPDLDLLFVTSIVTAIGPARPSTKPAQGAAAALDGAVFVLRPGTRGLAETPFAGTPIPLTEETP